jgi:hypothetical protein
VKVILGEELINVRETISNGEELVINLHIMLPMDVQKLLAEEGATRHLVLLLGSKRFSKDRVKVVLGEELINVRETISNGEELAVTYI